MIYLEEVEKGEKRNKAFRYADFQFEDAANEYLCVIADALTAIADVLEAQEQRELDRIKAEEEAKRETEERMAEWMKSLDKWREYPFEE